VPLSSGEFPDNVKHTQEISNTVLFSCILGWDKNSLVFGTFVRNLGSCTYSVTCRVIQSFINIILAS